MKALTTTPAFLLVMMCLCVVANGMTIVTSRSEKKWNEIQKKIENRMGGEFISTLEVNTGRPRVCNLCLQDFKEAFNIDFKVNNYHYVTFKGEPDENVGSTMISVMVVDPDSTDELEKRYKKLKTRVVLQLPTINPNIGFLSMDDGLLVMVTIGRIKLDERAKAVIAAIEGHGQENPQAPQKNAEPTGPGQPATSPQAIKNLPYTIDREGQFDASSEQLIHRFEKLRYGMTPEAVKELFPEPEQTRWGLHSVDRHYVMEICFQWQEEVFFCFSFLNVLPWVKGQSHNPDENSDDWRLQCAAVVREQTKIEDGQVVLLKRLSKPSVTYSYKKPKTEPQPAPSDRDKPSN